MLVELTNFKPDIQSYTPVYLQLANKLTEVIHNGQWQPEKALPSERVLSDALAVSRITARRAFDVLCERGLLWRKHGSGTYISSKPTTPVLRPTKFSNEMRQRGFIPGSQWLSREVGMATYEETLALKLLPNTAVSRLKRLRLADHIVMGIETTTIPKYYLPDPNAVTDTIYCYLEANHILPARALQHIHAVTATVEQARLAGVAVGAAMVYINRVGYLENGTAVEYTNSYCRDDYYEFLT
jgi:GntR family transcriptional regulator